MRVSAAWDEHFDVDGAATDLLDQITHDRCGGDDRGFAVAGLGVGRTAACCKGDTAE